MIMQLKEKLIGIAISKCLKSIHSEPISLKFATKDEELEISNIAKSGDIYTLDKHSIIKHYYYSEPANPYIKETYTSLADIVFDIAVLKGRLIYIPMSAYLISNPEKCTFPVLREFLIKSSPEKNNFDRLLLSMEVQKYLAGLVFHKVDKELGGIIPSLVDYFIFNTNPFRKKSLLLSLYGKWASGSIVRYYLKNKYSTISKSATGEPISHDRPYKIINTVGSSLVTLVDADKDGLPHEERIVVSPNGSELTIYDEHGKTKFHRL